MGMASNSQGKGLRGCCGHRDIAIATCMQLTTPSHLPVLGKAKSRGFLN